MKKAAEEEDLFIERMENLIKTLKRTYSEELDQIEVGLDLTWVKKRL